MFGYVTVCRDVMSEDDYRLFCAYYCGVCKATGHCASTLSRLGLSYDITFLALVIASVSKEENNIKQQRCFLHPFRKREVIFENQCVDYAACMGVILSYLKFIDDIHDDKSIKALICSILFYRGSVKVRRKYSVQYNEIKKYLTELSDLEQDNCSDIDKCADCFAKILGVLFTPPFISDTDTRRILEWMGYNIGRWIYIIDAYNDMEKDLKKGAYNPFLAGEYSNFENYRQSVREQLMTSLTFTLHNIASSFELLKPYRNRSVIEHIIYSGLKAKQSVILGEENGSV